jgi:chitinase
MKYQKSVLFILFLIFSFSIGWAQTIQKNDHEQPKRIIAYVYGWQDNWGPNLEKAKMITHINYAFANIKNGKVIAGNKNDGEVLKKLHTLKKVNDSLKILISVGGWGWSGDFSNAVLTEKSREVFANSAITFMQKHELDGIDLDWEYPGQVGAGNIFRPEDKENFTFILKLLRKKLDSLATPKEKYLLTIATGANQNYLDHTNMGEAQNYLDFNIMTYDFYTGESNETGHHANLFKSDVDTTANPRSVNSAVQQHLKAGVPAEKIVVGVPFYGRWWKGTSPKNNGRYQSSTGKTGGYDYKIIADSLRLNKTWVEDWDDAAQAPHIWRASDSLFLTYENPESLQLKVEYVKKNELGGIMFWEFNGDSGALLETIYQGF